MRIYDTHLARQKLKILPSEVLDNFFFPNVFRKISDPQMARFSHHPVYEYPPLLGKSYPIRCDTQNSRKKTHFPHEIHSESEVFEFFYLQRIMGAGGSE